MSTKVRRIHLAEKMSRITVATTTKETIRQICRETGWTQSRTVDEAIKFWLRSGTVEHLVSFETIELDELYLVGYADLEKITGARFIGTNAPVILKEKFKRATDDRGFFMNLHQIWMAQVVDPNQDSAVVTRFLKQFDPEIVMHVIRA